MNDAALRTPRFDGSRLSLKWLRSKLYPNVKSRSRTTIVAILETGLLFREDALQLEDCLQLEDVLFEGTRRRRFVERVALSPTEKVISVMAVGVCIAVLPLRRVSGLRFNFYRTLFWAGVGIVTPMLHRYSSAGYLKPFIKSISEYTCLLRKAISSTKHQFFSDKQFGNVTTLQSILVEQQKSLCLIYLNLNSELESLFPWLPTSSVIEFPVCNEAIKNFQTIEKVHNLFLILQSTLLKNVALAHLTPSRFVTKFLKNQDQKIHWIHSVLFPFLVEHIDCNCILLERAYIKFKDYSLERKKTTAIQTVSKISREPWKYAEVHANIVLCSAEIRSALTKCNEMDTFLEACWKANSAFSSQVFEDDLAKLKSELVKSFTTIDLLSLQLKNIKLSEMKLLERAVQKLQLPILEEEEAECANVKVVSEKTEVELEDQVFYFVKSDGDHAFGSIAEDNVTIPGKEEIRNNKFLLEELKVKLVKREDEMRERETIALENTMPEYKGKVPYFPRQINNDMKLPQITEDAETENSKRDANVVSDIVNLPILNSENGCANEGCSSSSSEMRLVPRTECNDNHKHLVKNGTTEGETAGCVPKLNSLYEYDDSNTSDDEIEQNDTVELLYDLRKNRVSRPKRYPPNDVHAAIDRPVEDDKNGKVEEKNGCENDDDLGSKPVEYKLGTNLAMASIFNGGRDNAKFIANGETFVGDGEVSSDSGNET